jgi:spore coat-associated protein N
MTASKLNRKVLVPLATLAAAGAVAVGSGATFTSTTNNGTSSVTSGTLTHTNSKNGAIFTIPNMKPGDVVNGKLTITNTGTLPASFTLREPSSTNLFGVSTATGAPNYLHLKITDDTTPTAPVTVFDGDFGGLGNNELKDLGTFDPTVAHSYNFAVSLDAAAPNSEQSKTASATYEWVSTQLSGTTTNQ